MAERIPRSEWTNLAKTFTEFFDGLGAVNVDNELLSFHSPSHHVQTGFSIHSSGLVNASMPLHGLQSKFEEFEFHPTSHLIICHAEASTYTYKVPDVLLTNRRQRS